MYACFIYDPETALILLSDCIINLTLYCFLQVLVKDETKHYKFTLGC